MMSVFSYTMLHYSYTCHTMLISASLCHLLMPKYYLDVKLTSAWDLHHISLFRVNFCLNCFAQYHCLKVLMTLLILILMLNMSFSFLHSQFCSYFTSCTEEYILFHLCLPLTFVVQMSTFTGCK